MEVKTKIAKQGMRRNQESARREIKDFFHPQEELSKNASSCSTNWTLLSNRLTKLEEQLSRLDAKTVFNDKLQKRASPTGASPSASDEGQGDSSHETSKRSSPATFPSSTSRSNSEKSHKSSESKHLESDKELKSEKKEKSIPNPKRFPRRRVTAVLEYFADRKSDPKTSNEDSATEEVGSRHAVKSAVLQNFADGRTNEFRASRDNLTRENINKILNRARERLQPKPFVKKELPGLRLRGLNLSKSRTKVVRKTSPENEVIAETQVFNVTSTGKRKRLSKKKSTKSVGSRKRKQTSKNETEIPKKKTGKFKPDEPKPNPKQSKTPKKRIRSSINIKNEIKKPQKSELKIRKPPSREKKEVNRLKSAKLKKTVSKQSTGSVKQNSDVQKMESSPKISITSSFDSGAKRTTKVFNYVSSISSRASNRLTPKSSILKACTPKRYDMLIKEASKCSKEDKPEPTPEPKPEIKEKEGALTIFSENPIVSEKSATIFNPKTRHLTDLEVQILVKDVEQISTQIQKYIKKWDEVLKTNKTADKDEDIRKTVLSACVLLDTKLRRAKELLVKYKTLTTEHSNLATPTAEMLEALLYYQLTQLDVASVIKTFRRLDSMLTAGK